jgi:Domain of unknown function (DUF4326)
MKELDFDENDDIMETKVVHCKKEDFDVYIGRPSKWGNPFVIGKNGTREDVVRKYREWILTQQHLLDSLCELHGKKLGCFCKPEACHGDVLVELAEQICHGCGRLETHKRCPAHGTPYYMSGKFYSKEKEEYDKARLKK